MTVAVDNPGLEIARLVTPQRLKNRPQRREPVEMLGLPGAPRSQQEMLTTRSQEFDHETHGISQNIDRAILPQPRSSGTPGRTDRLINLLDMLRLLRHMSGHV